MLSLWNRLQDFVIVGLLLLTGLVFMMNLNDAMTVGIRAAALEVSGFVEQRLAWLGALTFAVMDNQRLRLENAQLTSDLAQTRVALIENQQLREALGLQQDSSMTLVAARVVARDPHGQTNFFTLDVGRKDGVNIDMAVIDDRGILGRVVQVSAKYSRVMSYLNSDFFLPTMIEPMLAVGMLSWSGTNPDRLSLSNVINTEPVAPGQRVVTHWASEVFPPNLLVGTVSSVQGLPGLNAWEIEVEPASKLNTLQFAFVVIDVIDPEQTALEHQPIQ